MVLLLTKMRVDLWVSISSVSLRILAAASGEVSIFPAISKSISVGVGNSMW